MDSKISVAIVILASTLISILPGCRPSSPKYMPHAIDSASNDKHNFGLNGKVKTMDIYYYRPEKVSSLFSLKFKKGNKWEENGIHRYQFLFNADGNIIQHNEYNIEGNIIRKTDYSYDASGHTCTLSYPKTNSAIVRKYNADGQLLEMMYRYERNPDNDHGEINTYDDRGNLIRTEQTDGVTFKPAVTEYEYNDKNLLIEEREYYNKGELSVKTVYKHDSNDLVVLAETYDYLNNNSPETRFIYEYSDSNRVVKKYKMDGANNKELESWSKQEYHPNGKLKAIVRNGILQEEYDEQGRLINKTPGFEIPYKDFEKYDYDENGNWVKIKNFKDYVDFGTGIGSILKPYVERSFTYYEE